MTLPIPQIQIQSVSGRIGIQSQSGQYEIRQTPATIDIQTTDTVIDIQTEQPVVIIDMTKTRNALSGGKPEAFWNRIYSSYQDCAIRYIQRTVQEYNQIGDLTAGGNPVADVAKQSLSQQDLKLNVFGPAAYDNVDFQAIISKPEVNVQVGRADINVKVNKPDIQYNRGSVNVYMEQYASVTITPPIIDLTY
ncbi:DUF6470 family protein [Paenibacillus sp. YIM B09110]|uniref:DUF6470 family protein n=1 Tax=Paenibacillus sp. YIM B09110 TaxID=3126102 RepID=UPI00301BAA96